VFLSNWAQELELITDLLTGRRGLALTASRGTEGVLVFSDFDGNMVPMSVLPLK
jgi:hypothetical protein